MQDPLLIISNLNAYYGKSHVLQDINLIVNPAELVVLTGPNNAGKTSLLKCILGLPQVTRMGSIRFNKRKIIKKKMHKITGMGVGYVPQGRLLFPSMTVDEHLRFTWQKYKKKSQWTPEIIYGLFNGQINHEIDGNTFRSEPEINPPLKAAYLELMIVF
jgi:branched-chain amino acid transport system ATP-binding protein